MQSNGTASEAGGMTTQANEIMSQAGGMTPQAGGMTPQANEIMSQADEIMSQSNGMVSRANGTASQANEMAVQPSKQTRHVNTYRANAKIEQRLLLAQVAIEGVLADRDLQTALALRGYDQARMMKGKALRDQAEALFQQQRARTGDQRSARNARDTAQVQAHTVYMHLVALARVALRGEPGMMEALDIATARKYTVAGWLLQAKQFYANALNDAAILDKLAACGITPEELEQGRSQVEAVAAGEVARKQCKGTKQESTRVRDAALKALDHWMRDFKAVARVALAKQPQTLEKLGVVEPSSPAT